MSKQEQSPKICACGRRSLPGFRRGVALCQFHWDARAYGRAWALECAERDAYAEDATRAAQAQP